MELLSNYTDIRDLVLFSNENRGTSFKLADMANRIWQAEGSWELYEQHKQTFEPLVAKGFLKILENKNLEFKDRLTFEYFYSIYFQHSVGIQENKSLKEIKDLLWHRVYRDKNKKANIVLSSDFSIISEVLMHNFFLRNIFASYFESNGNGLEEINWNADKVIPYLNIDVDTLFSVTKEAQKTKESLMAGLANGIFELIKQKPEFGVELLKKVDADADPKIKGLLPSIINGLTAVKGTTFTLPIIIAKLSSVQDYDIKNALFILSRFTLGEEDWLVFGEAITEQLELLEKGSNEEYKLRLPEVYVRHLKFLPLAKEYLFEYSKSGNTKYQVALSNILWYNTKDIFREPWYETILLNAAAWDYSDPGIARQMAFCLLNLIERDTALTLKYLNAWITNKNNQLVQIKYFRHEITTLFGKKQELMEEWLTNAFLSLDIRFPKAMHFVVSELWLDGFKHLSLSKKILDTCTFWEVKYIICKIMANIHHKESLESLVFSILKKEPVNEPFWALVANTFMQHICYNYGSTYTYLKEKEVDASDLEKYVIQKVTENYDRYYSHVDKIRDVNELKWQNKNGVSFLGIKMKRMSKDMQKTMKESEENSFRSMFKSVSLKGGKKFFSKNEGVYSKPASLQDFGTSFELPKGEMIDPVRERLNMIGWNNYKIES